MRKSEAQTDALLSEPALLFHFQAVTKDLVGKQQTEWSV